MSVAIKKGRAAYGRRKERARAHEAASSAIGRDIYPLPPVVDRERREATTRDFRAFSETYFAEAFSLPWSADHHKVISKIARAVNTGGLFAVAMPRGSGKTTLATTACIWSTVTAARPFVVLIGATADRGREMLASIKTALESNDLLAEDYPEVCHPIRCLERIVHRAQGQTYLGQPTRIGWTADKVVYPTIPLSAASGAVLTATGLEGGAIRGQRHTRPDGTILRPSLVLIDDPQTTESAHSEMQSRRRETLLAGDVLGMAGPGQKIAGLMCCTVIAPGDMADCILDNEKHPQWQGERLKMVYSFPTNATPWETYRDLRFDSFRNGGNGEPATDFYGQNREVMDAGAAVAWPDRFNEDELSALQHAMNLKFRNEAAFCAECQNEPMAEHVGGEMLTTDQIARKTNNLRRGELPNEVSRVVAFVDVQQKLLPFVVAAFTDDFTGYVVDYGTWPDQRRPYFTLDAAKRTIAARFPRAGFEGALFSALEAATDDILGREYQRDDGAMLKVERCLIDANWGQSTDLIYQFARQTKYAGIVTPSHGKFVGASSIPFAEYKRRPGDRVGHFWRMPNVRGKRQVRYLLYDTNYWKTFAHDRLAVSTGDRGCLSIFGDKHADHRMFAEQLTAEYPVKVEGRGRTVDEWKERPGRDNHFLDCVVGCCVAACYQGAALPQWQSGAGAGRKRKRVTWAEMQARKNR